MEKLGRCFERGILVAGDEIVLGFIGVKWGLRDVSVYLPSLSFFV